MALIACTAVCALAEFALPAGAAPVWGDGVAATFSAGVQHTAPNATFNAVSCSSPGNCTAVGNFRNSAGYSNAFAETQADGVWSAAVPASFAAGVQAAHASAILLAVSCSSPGNCTAVGKFADAALYDEAFAQTQTDGVWGPATPATFAGGVQSGGPDARLNAVSCTSPGNCVAVGKVKVPGGGFRAFSQVEANGTWANGVTATFAGGVENASPNAQFMGVSCPSAGNCLAAGFFTDAAGNYEAFSQRMAGGNWETAAPAEFAIGVQNPNPSAEFDGVACPSAGNCTAVGSFLDAAGASRGFSETMTGGVWGTGTPLALAAGLENAYGPQSSLGTVSCASAGNCTAVGEFSAAGGGFRGVAQTATAGTWGTGAVTAFGAGVEAASPFAFLKGISCARVGACTAVGTFRNAAGYDEGFSQTMANGVWDTATPVTFAAGIQSSQPSAQLSSVACTSPGNCTAVGSFTDSANHVQAFSQTSTQAQTPGDSGTPSDGGGSGSPAGATAASGGAGTAAGATAAPRVPTMPRIRWSAATVRPGGVLRAVFTAAANVSFRISAVRSGRAAAGATGTCRVARIAHRRSATCSIRLRSSGAWLVSVTPSRGGTDGPPATKHVRVQAKRVTTRVGRVPRNRVLSRR